MSLSPVQSSPSVNRIQTLQRGQQRRKQVPALRDVVDLALDGHEQRFLRVGPVVLSLSSSSVTSPICTGGGSGLTALSSPSSSAFRLLAGNRSSLARRPENEIATYSAAATATAVKNASGAIPVYATMAAAADSHHSAIANMASTGGLAPSQGREGESWCGRPAPRQSMVEGATAKTSEMGRANLEPFFRGVRVRPGKMAWYMGLGWSGRCRR